MSESLLTHTMSTSGVSGHIVRRGGFINPPQVSMGDLIPVYGFPELEIRGDGELQTITDTSAKIP